MVEIRITKVCFIRTTSVKCFFWKLVQVYLRVWLANEVFKMVWTRYSKSKNPSLAECGAAAILSSIPLIALILPFHAFYQHEHFHDKKKCLLLDRNVK